MMLLFLGRQRDDVVVSGETERCCYWGDREMLLLGRQRDDVVSGETMLLFLGRQRDDVVVSGETER